LGQAETTAKHLLPFEIVENDEPIGESGAAVVNGQVEETERDTPAIERPNEPCAFVIFGASGDLTRRKLIPALYNLACLDLLPPNFSVIGFAATPMDDESFRKEMRDWVMNSPEAIVFRQDIWEPFVERLFYITGQFEDDAAYKKLSALLKQIDRETEAPDNCLFYLATPPSFYPVINEKLAQHGLNKNKGDGAWTRIIIEKPFGSNLQTAIDLNQVVHKAFSEDQVYRIDHYLGKETVQNIFAFRFANSIIEPIWNRRYVDHVQITACESLGVEHRASYYEEAGCLRDMFQNHLLQLMSLVAMDPPVRYDGRSVRDRKSDVLRAIVPINPEHLAEWAVRGQYGPGELKGSPVPGYRDELNVSPKSCTETYAALKLMVDTWRWADVPFYIRSGKRMPKKCTEISIQFKRVPHLFFQLGAYDRIEPNVLTIKVQPEEGISLKLGAKAPGQGMHIRQVNMEFNYALAFGTLPATAYETLLLDALRGDPTLFNRSDSVELAWEALAPIQETWQATRPFTKFPNYAAGTWGPTAADDLLANDGRTWKNA
jgi:glucose-6-phosphate 1-dehydrogenase